MASVPTTQQHPPTSHQHRAPGTTNPAAKTQPQLQKIPPAAAPSTTTPSDDPIYNPLHENFDPILALANPNLVKLPLKSTTGANTLSGVAHLLPFYDPNYKEQTKAQAGGTKHRVSIMLGTLQQQNQENGPTATAPLNLNTTIPQPKGAISHASLRFTSKVKVSKMPLKTHPLLFLKPTSHRLFNLLLRRQFTSILFRANKRAQYQRNHTTQRVAIAQENNPQAFPQQNQPSSNPPGLTTPGFDQSDDDAWGVGVDHSDMMNDRSDQISHQYGQQPYRHNSDPIPQNNDSNPSYLPHPSHRPHTPLVESIISMISRTGHHGDLWIKYFLLPQQPDQNQQITNTGTITPSAQTVTTFDPNTTHLIDPNTHSTTTTTTTTTSPNSIQNPYYPPQIQHTLPISPDPQHQPLQYLGMELKYPYLTAKQLLFMIFQTHFLRKCKVHQTRRKRLSYPCTCLVQPSPFPLPVPKLGTPSRKGDQTIAHQHPNQPPTTQQQQPLILHPKYIKAHFKQKHHTPGPFAKFESFLFSNTQKRVRINLTGVLPGAPVPIPMDVLSTGANSPKCTDTLNSTNPKIYLSEEILNMLNVIPPAPQYIYDILAQDVLFEGGSGPQKSDNDKATLFYNRSGNPRLGCMNKQSLGSTPQQHQQPRPKVSLIQGRMRHGISSIVLGKLVFFDRKGNLGLNDVTEFKWVWIPIKPTQMNNTCSDDNTLRNTNDLKLEDGSYVNNMNITNELNNHKRKKLVKKEKRKSMANLDPSSHGVWAILSRPLARTILTSATIATVAIEPAEKLE